MSADPKPVDQAWVNALAVSSQLSAVVVDCEDSDEVDALLHVLHALRDAKRACDFAYKEVEKQVIRHAGERHLEVPGLGVVEIKRSKKRSAWDIPEAMRAVVARIIDEPGVLADEEGEIRPPHHIAEQVAVKLRDAFGIYSGKVGGFRKLGLDVSEFCTEEDGVYSVVLPANDNEVTA